MKTSITTYILKHNEKKEQNLKYDFMPNILEIIERPAHRGGKVIIVTFTVFLLALFFWAAVSRMDIVVTASGTVNPVGNVSVVSIPENGVITDVFVSNGDYVLAGDVLAVEESDYADIDKEQLESEIQRLKCENELYQKILDGQNPEEISLSEYEESVQNVLEYIIKQEQFFEKSLERSMEGQSEERIALSKEEHELEIMEQFLENSSQLKELEASLAKVEKSLENQQIKAKVSGYVTGLKDGVQGEVVSAGSSLMSIVPKQAEMEIQCYVENSDIAQVTEEKEVVIKLQAYPYSDYGTLKGTVSYVSGTATIDETGKSRYLISVQIDESKESMELKPGMLAGVEITVGKRTVLDYFLEPLQKTADTAMKEK